MLNKRDGSNVLVDFECHLLDEVNSCNGFFFMFLRRRLIEIV